MLTHFVIKWQNNPKYDNLSRIFHIFLTALGEGGREGGSTQAVSLTAFYEFFFDAFPHWGSINLSFKFLVRFLVWTMESPFLVFGPTKNLRPVSQNCVEPRFFRAAPSLVGPRRPSRRDLWNVLLYRANLISSHIHLANDGDTKIPTPRIQDSYSCCCSITK